MEGRRTAMRDRRLLSALVVTLAASAWSATTLADGPAPPEQSEASTPHAHRAGSAGDKFLFGEPGVPSKVDRIVAVTMHDISFEPNVLEVKVGETIRFVVTNKSEADHDFTIGDSGTQTVHRKEMAEAMEKTGAMHHHHHEPNAISVNAGESGELIWKFTRAGNFEFDCNVPGHYEAGMKGMIRVVVGKGG
jgi:uncharacterized cupredoxin-like copper-binding protein